MKRSILVILAAALTFTLTGCGGGGSTTPTPPVNLPTLSGITAPDNTTGANGDYYLDTTTNTIYGPKAANVWPSGTIYTPTPTATPTPISVTLKSVAFANNSSAVTDGVYHLSNPGPIKINYDLSSYIAPPRADGSFSIVYLKVSFSNSQSPSALFDDMAVTRMAVQILGDTMLVSSGIQNVVGSLHTGDGGDTTYSNTIMSPTSAPRLREPNSYLRLLDFTKPTYILITAYTQDTNILFQKDVPTTYISSQIALPITIVP